MVFNHSKSGSENSAIKNGFSFAVQCLSGTGALRVGTEFLRRQLKCTVVLVSDPTRGNHKFILQLANFKEIKKYRYWDNEARNLDFAGMMEDLKVAPEQAVVILHGCAHNPTGIHLLSISFAIVRVFQYNNPDCNVSLITFRICIRRS